MKHFLHQAATVPATAQVSSFQTETGASEFHLLVRPAEYGTFAQQLDWLERAYREALAAHKVVPGSALFRRFLCSDLANQAPLLASRAFANRERPDEACAVSWVNQPPAGPAKVALWAYHVVAPGESPNKRLDGHTLTWQRNGHTYLWTTGITCPVGHSAHAQTRGVLQEYSGLLRARRLSLEQHAVRTWLFVQDIGANYEGVVVARRDYFREHGLTPETHFIASTGIEGGGTDVRAKVTLDAHAVAGLQPQQVSYLSAPDHLSPTHVYGVTFERGTRIAYRDRTHVIISGTASIDACGKILHPGDVARQLERALDNVDALLRQAGATSCDLAVLIAYVRDPADAALVRSQLQQRCGMVPVEVVVAAICRPRWLVEVEGVAVTAAARMELPAF